MDEQDKKDIRESKAVVITQEKGCNFCTLAATYDAKTVIGPWANMCEDHFAMMGVGLGLGLGQRLIVKEA